jgi:DNA-binding transcriptional ArsR family regulator
VAETRSTEGVDMAKKKARPRPSSEAIRAFIVRALEEHPADITRVTADRFKMTRQAAYKHMKALINSGVVEATGQTRNRRYSLVKKSVRFRLVIKENKEEDQVWAKCIRKNLPDLPENVMNILYYGFTEMYNNVIDHSGGTTSSVLVASNARNVLLFVSDDGIGIFEKIKQTFGLEDHRHAILELGKGKLTTDPKHHTGEGIFFSSRMFDVYSIDSGHLRFVHEESSGDWLLERVEHVRQRNGTSVMMQIARDCPRTSKAVFDRFSSHDGDYTFSRTHVPLKLATVGADDLVSRSQAKRVLSRFERFQEVLLDFAGIDSIGQAFADEIFRVFRRSHPEVELRWVNANREVENMILRVYNSTD